MILIDNIADLKNFSISSSQSVNVLGYYAKNDGGGGVFYFNSDSTLNENGGTIFQSNISSVGRWLRTSIESVINARWL